MSKPEVFDLYRQRPDIVERFQAELSHPDAVAYLFVVVKSSSQHDDYAVSGGGLLAQDCEAIGEYMQHMVEENEE